MASPILDEGAIVAALDPRAPLSLDHLRVVALNAILMAYDRKLVRTEFFEIGAKTTELLNAIVVMEFAYRLNEAYMRAGEHSRALEEGIEATFLTLKAARVSLSSLLQVVMECPEDTDKIN